VKQIQTPVGTTDSSSDEENDELPSGDIEGAALTEDMKARMKARNETPEEEASQGGERFRQLMERAKQQPQQQPQRQFQQQQYAPSPPQMSQPQQTATSQLPIPPDALNLPVEEQARLFRELLARQQMQQMNIPFKTPQQQPQQQSYAPPPVPQQQLDPYQQQYAQMMGMQPPPPPQQGYGSPSFNDPYQQQYQLQQQQQHQQHPQYVVQQMAPTIYHPQTSPHSSYLEPGVGFDGRKIGRNRDADTIANAADAYLARLKRDSTTRNLARYAGDEHKANDVFHDPEIENIQAPQLNPFLEEQRQRERDMLETVPEEMLVFQKYKDDETTAGDRSFSGISYKDRVAQMKANRRGAGGGGGGGEMGGQ
jgi:hypothetical protein